MKLVKRIYRPGEDGTRVRGRLRITWHDGVQMMLDEWGLATQQAERCMQYTKNGGIKIMEDECPSH